MADGLKENGKLRQYRFLFLGFPLQIDKERSFLFIPAILFPNIPFLFTSQTLHLAYETFRDAFHLPVTSHAPLLRP